MPTGRWWSGCALSADQEVELKRLSFWFVKPSINHTRSSRRRSGLEAQIANLVHPRGICGRTLILLVVQICRTSGVGTPICRG